MIFTAPRYIVIDDKEHHLSAITKTFLNLGTSCVGLQYDHESGLNKELFRGVRCLFMDLHLIDGQASTDQKRHFALIAQILEDSIHKNGGPFILVVWTEHPHYASELSSYLDEKLDPQKSHTRPIAVISLDKSEFINIDDGALKNHEAFKAKVNETITSNPQLSAVLSWEMDVLRAASDTLVSLMHLIPDDKKKVDSFSHCLDEFLSRLAKEAVGASNVEADKRAALNSALAPILIDRVINQTVDEPTKKIWNEAITKFEECELASAKDAAQINRMLHIANPDFETILPTDWGAVVEWPFSDNDDSYRKALGLTKKELFCKEFKLRSKAISSCKLKLLRIGAVCDYAQNNNGPITFLLAAEIPESAERQQANGNAVRLSDSIWESPIIELPGIEEPARLFVHQRFPMTVLKDVAGKFKSTCRIREQMLMNIITYSSNYSSRPGMLQMPCKKQ